MSYAELFSSAPEAIIEIEETYLRFLIPVARGWKSHYLPFQGGDVFGALRHHVPELLGAIHAVSLVLWNEAGARILPFPVTMAEKEILEHLNLKREDYFGTNVEMVFALRPLALIDQKNREYLVSSVTRGYFNRLQNIFTELGYNISRITTAFEAAIGRFQQQRKLLGHHGSACIISLGYSQVHMIVLRQGEVIAMRTALTGSVKELENRLVEALKLKTDKIEEYLTGRVENPDSNTVEIIQQNMRELLARITPFFAFIRSKEKERSDQTIYLSLPCLEIKGLKELLEQSFSLAVKPLDESAVNDDSRSNWLQGILYPSTVSLLPRKPPLFSFILTPRIIWLFSFFFLCTPFAFIKINHDMVKGQMKALQLKEEKSRLFLQRDEMTKSQQAALKGMSDILLGELPKSVTAASLVIEISKRVPANVRIVRFDYSPNTSNISLSGIALNTETALSFWEALKRFPWLTDPKISFSPGNSDFSMGFVISSGVIH
ncbi:MAG: pilus assembly protein PilM [Candidatus Riflebacteria bacterium]|nr:pilus assembly protein PilM [Candidatus Riflebacteria bacterium]